MFALRLSTRQNISDIPRRYVTRLQSKKEFVIERDFGKYVFSEKLMEARLPPNVFKKYKECTNERKPIDVNTADVIALCMKDWAIEHGATHFGHWFQPLNGWIAQKDDSFCAPKGGFALSSFRGKALIGGEPDASSFPSGGLRVTHEARGYTVWDPQTPAFLMMEGGDPTLIIPAVFYSFKGHALDRKIPLLRSCEALNKSVLPVLELIGEKGHTRVHSDSGVEQEFFIIHEKYYRSRPDLVLSGRTTQGAAPTKGQELNDHYFAPLPSKALQLISEIEKSLWSLGIPMNTRHQEVAPNQFEMAPVFESASVASDHNMLMMEVAKRIAENNKMQVLLHEKPFANLNGSGKHNNWSIGTNKIPTMMDPGPDPANNLTFLLTTAAVLRGVDIYQDLMRFSICGAGNDHRLGGHEAPPAIFSVYLGDTVSKLVKDIAEGKEPDLPKIKDVDLGVPYLPKREMDNTDRNRTSPVAFTGNKFEVRCVGASQVVATSNLILNTITADSFDYLGGLLKEKIGKGVSIPKAVKEVCRDTFQKHLKIINEGNGYDKSWPETAVKRGLFNFKTTPDVLNVVLNDRNIKVFDRLGVWSKEEFESNVVIEYEKYIAQIHLEAQGLRKIADCYIIPSSVSYLNSLRHSGQLAPTNRVERISKLINSAVEEADGLDAKVTLLNTSDHKEGANYCLNTILPQMHKLRNVLDELERYVDAKLWPLPTYEQMLYARHSIELSDDL